MDNLLKKQFKMKKSIIVCIVGESGVGKTTLINHLSEKDGFSLISSYTTRPMRNSEHNGIEHIFVNADDMPDRTQMIAYTYFGNHHYWATLDQVQRNNYNLYAIDEKGLIELEERFNDIYTICKVYICRSNRDNIDTERMERDNDRIVLDSSKYDYVINNNGNLQEFINFIDTEFVSWLQKNVPRPSNSNELGVSEVKSNYIEVLNENYFYSFKYDKIYSIMSIWQKDHCAILSYPFRYFKLDNEEDRRDNLFSVLSVYETIDDILAEMKQTL